MKILSFGSLNLDNVYQVSHHVRAGETLASSSLEQFAGGKGLNQSLALARAGAEVWHAGQIGPDGERLRTLLEENGVNCRFLRQGEERTGHTVIQVDRDGQNCILLYGGANRSIPKGWMEEAVSHFEAGDILLLQNEINDIAYLVELARRRGMRIALNPSPMDERLAALALDGVEWLLLNEIEGEALTGSRDAEEICAVLLARYPGIKVVLTLGSAGARYQDAAQRHVHGSFEVPVVDTTAAGDTFTGYFLEAAVRGTPVSKALERASLAAALAVSHPGAAPSIPSAASVDSADFPLRKNRED